FGAKLQFELLVKGKFSSQCEVRLPGAKSANEIARCVSEGVRRGSTKGGRVYRAPSGKIGVVEVQWFSRLQVQTSTNELAGSRIYKRTAIERYRKASSSREAAIETPVM